MLEVLVLGTAAGGGFPQWNCACPNCRLARAGVLSRRLQSALAVSGNGRDWHFVNASPDVAVQLERFIRPRLTPSGHARDMPVRGIFLTNADLDHTLGLFQLREGKPLTVTAPAPVRESLERGLALGNVIGAYAGLRWQEAREEWQPVDDTGLEVRCVPLAGSGPPRYDAPAAGTHAVGYLFRKNAVTVGIFPDVAVLDTALLAALESCERVWLDGTFCDEDELVRLGFSTRRAADMGHVPISGENGSLAALSKIGPGRVAYLHINNTNPILRPDSAERRALEAAGLQVAEDGEHFRLGARVND